MGNQRKLCKGWSFGGNSQARRVEAGQIKRDGGGRNVLDGEKSPSKSPKTEAT